VLSDDVNDLLVELMLLRLMFLPKSVGLFKSVSNLVVEVNLLSELDHVLLLDLLINFIIDFILNR
jgi:hypothetical protein